MVEEVGLDEGVEEVVADSPWPMEECLEGNLPQTCILVLHLTLVLLLVMLQHLHLDNLLPPDLDPLELRAHVECRNRKLRIFPLEHTKISQMVNTNAQSAPMKFCQILRYGTVKVVGRFSIYHVSKNGRRTKCPHINNEQLKMENCHHRDSGDVPVVTCPKKTYQYHILVGVRRRLNHDQ